MSLEQFFCLSGYGYLEDIAQLDGKFIARIKVLMHLDSSTSNRDDVLIDCEVESTTYQLRLTSLLRFVRMGEKVLIDFVAEYSAFKSAYSGQTPEDPNHIITLHAKLCLMKSCYINGHVAKCINTQLRAVL